MSNEGETVPTAEVQSEETTQPSKSEITDQPTETPVESQPDQTQPEEQAQDQAPETVQEAPPADGDATPAEEANGASTQEQHEAYQDGAGTGNGFMTSQDFGVGEPAGITAGNFDASGGYSAHGTGGFHDMGMGPGDMGMGQMGGDMQGQQFDQGFQIKSNPEHGKMLKKVGPSDLKMFIGGLSHETTTDKLKDYFATWGEG